ncbi:hypothetical protein GCM10023087_12710 [Microbacterium rhizosphaerae]
MPDRFEGLSCRRAGIFAGELHHVCLRLDGAVAAEIEDAGEGAEANRAGLIDVGNVSYDEMTIGDADVEALRP